MDKYEYNLKVDQIKSLMADEKYQAAADIVDSINWNKVRNINALVKAAEAYDKVERYSDCRELLYLAYDRSPIGRTIVYKLAEVSIKLGDYSEAEEYYREFVDIAPRDNLRYILRYNIRKNQGASIDELIPILEEFKDQEYTEEWAYELAYLYHKSGAVEKCIDACDDLILWFGEGPYVERALELKMLYQPLTKLQEEKYRKFRLDREGSTAISGIDMEKAGEFVHEPVVIPKIEINQEKFNTVNLQKEIAKSMQQIMEATEKDEVSDTMDNIMKIVEDIPYLQIPRDDDEKPSFDHIETDEEIDDSLKSFNEMLNEDSDGQIRLVVDDRKIVEKQITGQMSIQDILDEWEKTRSAAEAALIDAEQRKLESAKARALIEAEDLMERLNDVIPKLDAGVTPVELLEEEYLQDIPVEETVEEPVESGEPVESEEVLPEIDFDLEEFINSAEQPVEEQEREPEATPFVPLTLEIPDFMKKVSADAEAAKVVVEDTSAEDALASVLAAGAAVTGAAVAEATETAVEAAETVVEEVIPEVELPEIDLEEDVVEVIEPEVDTVEVEVETVEVEAEPEVETVEVEAEPVEITDIDIEDIEEEAEEVILPEVVGTVEVSVSPEVKVEEPEDDVIVADGVPTGATIVLPKIQMPEDIADVAADIEFAQTRRIPDITEALEAAAEVIEEVEAVEEAAEIPEVAEVIEEVEAVEEAVEVPEIAEIPEVAEVIEEVEAVEKMVPVKEITKLSDDQKKIFTYFVPISGMEEQICSAMTNIITKVSNKDIPGTANVIIKGESGCGKTVLAKNLIDAIQLEGDYLKGTVGKIDAGSLNGRDPLQLLNKVAGGCLIIEKAGELNQRTATTLGLLMGNDTNGTAVILEGTSKGIKKALSLDDGFTRLFKDRISIPIFTNDELVAFAREYASELGYEIEEMAILALYNRISNIQRLDQATTLAEIKEIVDEAIDREAHSGLKKAFSILTAKRYTDDDKIVLTERHFEEK